MKVDLEELLLDLDEIPEAVFKLELRTSHRDSVASRRQKIGEEISETPMGKKRRQVPGEEKSHAQAWKIYGKNIRASREEEDW